MLKNEDIQAILKVKTATPNVSRAQKIMYCDNTVKELFIYNISDVIKEVGIKPQSFDEQIEICLIVFNKRMHSYFNNEDVNLKFFNPIIKLNLNILRDAELELRTLSRMLKDSNDGQMINYEMIKEIRAYNISNYIAILEVLGIVDVNNCVYCSKILARLLNIKEQIDHFMVKKMDITLLISELKSHNEFFYEQVAYIDKFKLYGQDFILYPILFDMRKNKENKKTKVLSI